MEKIEKNMKVKREKFLSEKAINDVLNDFNGIREYTENKGNPINCMCIMCSAGLCGNASPMDYMSMITSTLVHLIEGNVIDIEDLSIIVKTTLKYLEESSKDETKNGTKDDIKKLISALDELKDILKNI